MQSRIVLLVCAAVLVSSGCTHEPRRASYLRMAPCPTEDSAGCYWDAKVRGNGQGESFWTEADGTVHMTG